MSTEGPSPRRQYAKKRRAVLSIASGVAALLGAAALNAQEIPPLPPPGLDLPHVVLMAMGGEISSSCDARLDLAGCETTTGTIGPEAWMEDLPELLLLARVTGEDLRPSERADEGLTVEHWHTVARRLQELTDDPGVDGIVVAHGTGRLTDTAFFMNLVVRTRKPIVFVGAQRPWTGMSGDGPLSLYNAVRVAATPAAGGKGVLHATNQEVHAARDVMKTSATRMNAFESVDLGLIAVADPDTVKFLTEPTRRHTYRSEFPISALPKSLPAVEIVPTYADPPGHVIDELVAAGVKGLVVDGAGPASLSGGQVEAVRRAQAKGIVVVATARTRGGRVQETASTRESGIIAGDNLAPEKARTLLRLALTRTTDPKEIKRIFDEY